MLRSSRYFDEILLSSVNLLSFSFFAPQAGALRYEKGNPDAPGVLLKAPPGKLGAAFAAACHKSWRVVKELSGRFPQPIPRSVLRSIRDNAAARAAAVSGGNGGSIPSSGVGGGGGSDDDGAKLSRLCVDSPGHWSCRGAAAGFNGQPPPPAIKVRLLAAFVQGSFLFAGCRLLPTFFSGGNAANGNSKSC